MRRILTLMSLLAVIGALLVPSVAAFADQTSHTTKFHFDSLDQEDYPLKDGFVLSIHMNGPIYFEKKEFQLRGAKPDTQFFIYRVFKEEIIYDTLNLPIGTPLPSGDSFWTDKHGNGHVITNMPPDALNLQLLKSLGINEVNIKNVLCDGSTPAYETESLPIHLDFDWTPELQMP